MDAFTKEGVVPLMLDNKPLAQLSVRYEDDPELQPGEIRTPTQVRNKPVIRYQADPGSLYTLIFNDPDAPSRTDQTFGEFNHWLVTNIPGSDIDSGDEASEYVGSGPGKGSGLHRYVFFLYKQKEKLSCQKITKTERIPRRHWKIREFAKIYKLEGPVAGNFFQAEYDDWVPNIQRQLGIIQ